ncbi:MAG: MarR family transcriptional regulator [Anaerovoracaceae bacterium]|nr:MarR family transcriptional regulator [Anaerovoracaceae bacterium]
MSEKSQILDTILRLNRNIKRRAAARGGVNGKAQGKTLLLIAQNDGIRSSDLARLLDIRPPSLTQKLNKLEEDGNIKRMCDVHDARVIRLYITEAGKEILRRRDLGKERVTKDFSDCLTSEEKALFCEFCDRLSNNLEAISRQEKEALEFPNVVSFYPTADLNEEPAAADKSEAEEPGENESGIG